MQRSPSRRWRPGQRTQQAERKFASSISVAGRSFRRQHSVHTAAQGERELQASLEQRSGGGNASFSHPHRQLPSTLRPVEERSHVVADTRGAVYAVSWHKECTLHGPLHEQLHSAVMFADRQHRGIPAADYCAVTAGIQLMQKQPPTSIARLRQADNHCQLVHPQPEARWCANDLLHALASAPSERAVPRDTAGAAIAAQLPSDAALNASSAPSEEAQCKQRGGAPTQPSLVASSADKLPYALRLGNTTASGCRPPTFCASQTLDLGDSAGQHGSGDAAGPSEQRHLLARMKTHVRVAAEMAAAAWEEGLALHRKHGFGPGAAPIGSTRVAGHIILRVHSRCTVHPNASRHEPYRLP